MKSLQRLLLFFLFTISTTSFSQNALVFDGVNDAVNCGNSSQLQITGKAMTLEAWIYPTSWTKEVWRGNVVVKEQNSDNSGYMFRVGENGKLNFAIGSGSGPWKELTTATGILSLNTWQHIAGSYDGKKMRLYLNGKAIDSLSTTISIGNANSVDLNIGGNIPSSRYYTGKIDEVRLWDIVRTSKQIAQSRNVELCQQNGLVAYYQFNQGIANGTNSTVTSLVDSSGNSINGALSNLALTGSTSNWTTGVALNAAGNNAGIDVQTGCSPFVWIDGISYTSNNTTATHTINNIAGCDSLVTLNLTLSGGKVTFSTDKQSSCDPIIWIDGNFYSTDNNSATYTLTNSEGCDSIITLDYIRHLSTYSKDSIVSCDPIVWLDGKTYSENNNSATYNTTNSNGCDSIITLNLTIAISYGTDIRTSCGPITWIDGNSYSRSNFSATHSLINSNGCDSVVTLNLTIQSIDISTSITENPVMKANLDGAIYQWLDCNDNMKVIPGATNQTYKPKSKGRYAVVITSSGCTDTSNCVIITHLGLGETNVELGIKIFPNPTHGSINLHVPTSLNDFKVSIKDITGRLIVQEYFAHSTEQVKFELEGAKGVYLVEVESATETKVIKVLKL